MIKMYYNLYSKGKDESFVYDEICYCYQNNEKIEDIDLIINEMLRRININIKKSVAFLKEKGYNFSSVELIDDGKIRDINLHSPYSKNSVNEFNCLDKIDDYGYIPKIFLEFMMKCGSVDLIGFFPEWKKYPFYKNLDPLVIYPMPLIDKLCFELLEYKNSLEMEYGNYYIPFSPSKDYKSGVGNGLNYGIILSSKRLFDSRIANHFFNLSFINYLRVSLKWLGLTSLEYTQNYFKEDPLFQEIKTFSKEEILLF